MTEKKKDDYMSTNPHAMMATVKPYIAGARVQLQRYLEAQQMVKVATMSNLDRCMYELSALLEHLDCIEAQLRNRKITLSTGETIRQFRNHLRHDARGEDEDKRSVKRSQAIGLHDKARVFISFTDNGVKMGSTELTAQQVDTYIMTAETIMWALVMGGKIEIDGETVTTHLSQADITTKDSSEEGK